MAAVLNVLVLDLSENSVHWLRVGSCLTIRPIFQCLQRERALGFFSFLFMRA